MSMSGARLRGERLTYSEVENRKKGDVFLKALPKHTMKGKTQTLIDSIVCNLLATYWGWCHLKSCLE